MVHVVDFRDSKEPSDNCLQPAGSGTRFLLLSACRGLKKVFSCHYINCFSLSSVYCSVSTMTPGALLLLLAAAASQVDLSQSVIFNMTGGQMDISSCPITFYGISYSWIEVQLSAVVKVVLKTEQNGTSSTYLLLMEREESNNVTATIHTNTTAPGSDLHAALTNITSTSTCYLSLEIKNDSTDMINFYFYNFDPQAAVKILSFPGYKNNVTIFAYLAGLPSMLGDFFPNQTSSGLFIDISGCKTSGSTLKPGSSILDSDSCSTTSCSPSAVYSNVSTCGPFDVCLGNNTCQPPFVCTVTGSTIIDFYNRNVSIEDRCDYVLMKPAGSNEFELKAGFQERRRKDVSFLDHLIIKLKAGNIYLGQGGRVGDGNQTLMLNATAQVVHGVKLSKDQTGVTAELPTSSMKVFFDGNTAHVSGPREAVEGLCGNPSNQSQVFTSAEMKSSSSASGCDTQYNDTIDITINCNRSSDHCDLLKQSPFSACHNHSDPAPFVDACKHTLCNYPALDGLDCQFMEAYAESCRLKANVTLSDWRSKVNCSAAPPASCLDQYCSGHEFCGEKLGGTSCLCRALFASKYTPTSALGEPTVCTNDSATVTLAGCLLQDKGIDYSVLHLNDPSCKGRMDNQTHMVTFSFDSSNTCGTNVSMNNSQILYNNAIVTRNASESGVITRHDQVRIDFSCLYTKPDIRSVSFRIKDSSVVQQIVSGVWNYTLMMNAYTDAGRMSLINQSTPIQLNQKVWVELKTEGLDGDMVSVVTDSCWATNQSLANGSVRYELVKDGCPNKADQTVKMEGNGLGTSSSFSFNMFEFSNENSEIFLHCQLELCPKQDSCAPTCGGAARRRRSFRADSAEGNPALISMVWSH